jgi:hypothetical protein
LALVYFFVVVGRLLELLDIGFDLFVGNRRGRCGGEARGRGRFSYSLVDEASVVVKSPSKRKIERKLTCITHA